MTNSPSNASKNNPEIVALIIALGIVAIYLTYMILR